MTTLPPYAEKVVSDYLRSHPSVVAITNRVMGGPPSKTDTPWVRVTQLDAANTPGSIPEHLLDYLFQFDCYAGKDGGQPQASVLARTVRAALVEMPERESDPGAVVTAVRIVGHAHMPDVDVDEPARERYVLTASVYLHA